MTIELATASETSPVEILDVQVTTRRAAGRSLLSMRFLFHKKPPVHFLKMPPLSWFDAGQMQRFTQELANARHPQTVRVDLIDAGMRLTGSVRSLAGRWTTGRTIRVEPLSSELNSFVPFTIHASPADLNTYAAKLYSRLWEVITRR